MNVSGKKKVTLLLRLYELLFIFLVAGSVLYVVKIYLFSQTCLARQQVQSDARCLYIFNNQVFEKGTRSSPHKGHACGADITALIPSSHRNNPVIYFDPNYKGGVCADRPIPSPTATPTPIPPRIPTQVNTRFKTSIRIIPSSSARISVTPPDFPNSPTVMPLTSPSPISTVSQQTIDLGLMSMIASYLFFGGAVFTSLFIIVVKLRIKLKKQ